jgi:hypothetical protein
MLSVIVLSVVAHSPQRKVTCLHLKCLNVEFFFKFDVAEIALIKEHFINHTNITGIYKDY